MINKKRMEAVSKKLRRCGVIFEALPARYGDCLFLSFLGPERPLRLLVDGGPAGVFRTSLKSRLEQEQKAYREEVPLTIDAVMISHIDEDHILGILDLFGVLQDAEQRHAPWPYRPRWLLHNSFDALAGEGEGGTARALGEETVLAGLGNSDTLLVPNGRTPDPGAMMVLQSYSQGSKLSTMAAALKVTRNPPDQEVLSFSTVDPRVLRIGEATLTIVGPLQDEIDKLREKWHAWKKATQKDNASLASYLDDSIPNLSSIVVLVELRGRSILLTGDARGDYILDGLTKAGLVPNNKPLLVDVLKLPHHGSARNIDLGFFQSIHAEHYVASGDGTYGNPDRETLELIEEARPEGKFTVHLTYAASECDATHKVWRAKRKGVDPFEQGHDSIADVVERWRGSDRIKVQEGPVRIELHSN